MTAITSIVRSGYAVTVCLILMFSTHDVTGTDLVKPTDAPPSESQRAALLLNGISLPTQIPQGGLLIGRVPPGAKVWQFQPADPAPAGAINIASEINTVLRVSKEGLFVYGVGQDETKPISFRIRPADAPELIVQVTVKQRRFKTEKVTGVPQKTVTPPPEIAERIGKEQARVAKARQRDDDRSDFADGFVWPATGRISGVFGSRRIYNGTPLSTHSGLDIAVPTGTPVKAPAAGIVIFADPDLYLTGGTLLIDHGHGISSNFLHLSKIDVKVGDRIEQGEVIATVGATGRASGPHLHWGMNWFATRIDPQLLVEKNPSN